jgi:hypothetical protein
MQREKQKTEAGFSQSNTDPEEHSMFYFLTESQYCYILMPKLVLRKITKLLSYAFFVEKQIVYITNYSSISIGACKSSLCFKNKVGCTATVKLDLHLSFLISSAKTLKHNSIEREYKGQGVRFCSQ